METMPSTSRTSVLRVKVDQVAVEFRWVPDAAWSSNTNAGAPRATTSVAAAVMNTSADPLRLIAAFALLDSLTDRMRVVPIAV
mmetsp:Transcript_7013/g.12244  ORF Transcript_7013/g.12244 Transcript_7013/m.12244 type:complete len:83 (+) Transcript_7013:164-412(+)